MRSSKIMWIDEWAFLPANLVDSASLEKNLVMPLTREERWAKLRLEAERPLRRLTEEQIKEWMPHRRI